MNDPEELLALRLGLLAIILLFLLLAALTLRMGLRPRRAAAPAVPAGGGAALRGAASLVVVVAGQTGLRPGTEFALAGEMTLGRDGVNSIVLADASVSSRHASVEQTRTGWRVTDLGSTNGTALNGRPVDGRGRGLDDGDQLVLGGVVLRFRG